MRDYYKIRNAYPQLEVELRSLLAHPSAEEARSVNDALAMAVFDSAYKETVRGGKAILRSDFRILGEALQVDVEKAYTKGCEEGRAFILSRSC